MYETLARLWRQDDINETHLDNAVAKDWITEEEKVEIMSQGQES